MPQHQPGRPPQFPEPPGRTPKADSAISKPPPPRQPAKIVKQQTPRRSGKR